METAKSLWRRKEGNAELVLAQVDVTRLSGQDLRMFGVSAPGRLEVDCVVSREAWEYDSEWNYFIREGDEEQAVRPREWSSSALDSTLFLMPIIFL